MELTIPVLISGARFNQLIRFNMRRRKFIAYVWGVSSTWSVLSE